MLFSHLHIEPLLQAVTISSDLLSRIMAGVQTLGVIGIGYVARTLRANEKRSLRLQNIVIGDDGKNGLRSRVATLEKKKDEHEISIAEIRTELRLTA